MENKDYEKLVSTFIEYRDLLTPIKESLEQFAQSFKNVKSNIDELNKTIGGDVKSELDQIHTDLSKQAEKSNVLATNIDNFAKETNKYLSSLDKLSNTMLEIENKLSVTDELEKNVEQAITRLDGLLKEKSNDIDRKVLEKDLETYNANLEKITQFINKDILEVMKKNFASVQEIRDKNNSVYEMLNEENKSIAELIKSYSTSNELLKKIVEKNDVNEDYLYSILDQWALDRKVKIKK